MTEKNKSFHLMVLDMDEGAGFVKFEHEFDNVYLYEQRYDWKARSIMECDIASYSKHWPLAGVSIKFETEEALVDWLKENKLQIYKEHFKRWGIKESTEKEWAEQRKDILKDHIDPETILEWLPGFEKTLREDPQSQAIEFILDVLDEPKFNNNTEIKLYALKILEMVEEAKN